MEIDIVHHRTDRWEKDSQRKPGSAASKQGRDSQWACAMILLVGWTPIRECQVVLKCKSQHPRPCRLDCNRTLHVRDIQSFPAFVTFKEKIWIPRMMMLMRARFVRIVGKPFYLTEPGTNTCRTMFATSLCPGPQCHLGTLRHPIFHLSCSKRTSWWDTPARILYFPQPLHHTGLDMSISLTLLW